MGTGDGGQELRRGGVENEVVVVNFGAEVGIFLNSLGGKRESRGTGRFRNDKEPDRGEDIRTPLGSYRSLPFVNTSFPRRGPMKIRSAIFRRLGR